MTCRIACVGGVRFGDSYDGRSASHTLTDIGALKGDNESNGFWINNLGEVVGYSDVANSEGYPCTGLVAGQHAFSWTKSGGIKDLGTLSGATAAERSA